jgi:hypothetical protein
LLGLAPFGLFACGAEIDDVAHAKLGGKKKRGCGQTGRPLGQQELRRHGGAGSPSRQADAVHPAGSKQANQGHPAVPNKIKTCEQQKIYR